MCRREPFFFGLALLLFGVLLWTSFGHHRYYLRGDPVANFRQYLRLSDGHYFSANVEAWSQRRDGVPPEQVNHVKLMEAGFPFLLYLAGHFGDRAPYMVNVVLLPFLLLCWVYVIGLAGSRPDRRILAALFGMLILLYFPSSASRVWQLAMPFRDTLSHLLGFGSLAILFASADRGGRPFWWVVCAGVLAGLSAWARLTGALFVFPAALTLLCVDGFGPFRRRCLLMVPLAVGVTLGIGVLFAQMLFEGRGLMGLPQADTLVLVERMDESPGAIRRGLHPANFPIIAPQLISRVWATYPSWLNVFLLIGIVGWLVGMGRRAGRVLPLLCGVLVYVLLYGCYDKVVARYAFVIVLFHTAVLALGAGWYADLIIARLAKLRPLSRHLLVPLGATVLAVLVALSALKSGPDWGEKQQEWENAQRTRAWLERYIPPDKDLVVTPQGFRNWMNQFIQNPLNWNVPFRHAPTLDSVQLPIEPEETIFAIPFIEEADQYARGWLYDALLNHFDLEPHGTPLYLDDMHYAGMRLFRVRDRSRLERRIAVDTQDPVGTMLYLYLRDFPDVPETEHATLLHPQWPRPWPVRIRPGVNLLTIPPDFDARPDEITLRAAFPLPSILEATWAGTQPVRVHLWEYEHIATRLLQVDGERLFWWGYPSWWRDWGAHAERYQSVPRVILANGSRLRVPNVDSASDHRIIMRAYYSVAAEDEENAQRGVMLRYRLGHERLGPVVVPYSNPYGRSPHALVYDVMHELEIEPGAPGADDLWLEIEMEGTQGDESPLLYLHRIAYFLEDGAVVADGPEERRNEPKIISHEWRSQQLDQWLWGNFTDAPWSGYEEKQYIRQVCELIPDSAMVLADGRWGAYWRAYAPQRVYNPGPRSAEADDYVRIRNVVVDALEAGREVFLYDSAIEESNGLRQRIEAVFDVEALKQPDATVFSGEGALYRVRPWSQRRVETELDPPAAGPWILRVRADYLWRPDVERTFTRLLWNEHTIAEEMGNGFFYHYMPGTESSGRGTLVLESDGPLPSGLQADLLPAGQPIVANVSPGLKDAHVQWILGDEHAFTAYGGALELPAMWALRFPRVWPADRYGLLVELEWLADDTDERDLTGVSITAGEQEVAHVARRAGRRTVVSLLTPEAVDPLTLNGFMGAGYDERTPLGLRTIRLIPLPLVEKPTIDLGHDRDRSFVGAGFHGRERFGDKVLYRWSSSKGRLLLVKPKPMDEVVLRITYADARPEGAPSAEMHVYLDDLPVVGHDVEESLKEPFKVWEGRVRLKREGPGIHLLDIHSVPWQPAEFLPTRDQRSLGVMLHQVEMLPVAASAE